MNRFEIDLRSLPVQMILSFIGLILLTAAAVGLPAIWLIHNQLERQAWVQVEQGSRAAQALYQVFVGILLDDEFATQMRTKTGLEHTLLVNGQPVTTSLADPHPSQIVHSKTLGDAKRSIFMLGDRYPYYARIFPLTPLPNEAGGKPILEAEMALAVSDITATQQSLV